MTEGSPDRGMPRWLAARTGRCPEPAPALTVSLTVGERAGARVTGAQSWAPPPPESSANALLGPLYRWKMGRYCLGSCSSRQATAVENSSPGPTRFGQLPSSRCMASRSRLSAA